MSHQTRLWDYRWPWCALCPHPWQWPRIQNKPLHKLCKWSKALTQQSWDFKLEYEMVSSKREREREREREKECVRENVASLPKMTASGGFQSWKSASSHTFNAPAATQSDSSSQQAKRKHRHAKRARVIFLVIGSRSIRRTVHSNDLAKFFGGLRCTARRKLEIYNL